MGMSCCATNRCLDADWRGFTFCEMASPRAPPGPSAMHPRRLPPCLLHVFQVRPAVGHGPVVLFQNVLSDMVKTYRPTRKSR